MSDIIKIDKEISILYVEDEKDIQEGYAKALKKFCTQLYVASNGQEGLELYKEYKPDIVISDINMPLIESISLEVSGYLMKPIDKQTLKAKIEKLSASIFQKREIQQQQKNLQNILDAQQDILIVTNFKELMYANRAFLDLYTLKDTKEYNKTNVSILYAFLPIPNYLHQGMLKDGETFYDLVNSMDEEQRTVTLIGSDGRPKAYDIAISKIEYNKEDNFLINLTDITKRNITKIDTEKKAYYDELTGIYNRAKFNEYFEAEVNRVKRYKNSSCVAILDIDHFKKFNDTHGHLIGDEVLVLLADSISKNIRKTDIFARWGGEEFVLLFQETQLEDAFNVVESLRTIIENTPHPTAGKVTVSFGVTQIGSKDSIKSALSRCDKALYIAKENGRNRVETILEDDMILESV